MEMASLICRNVKGIGRVGVFVNAPLSEVIQIVRQCRLDFVQLHGRESPEYCRKVRIPVIKAFQIGDGFSIERISDFDAAYILCDSLTPGCLGGSGVAFDWHKAKTVLQQIKMPVLVAGGLAPHNVKTAINILRPAGVDVSGGVETNGIKDSLKIKEFIQAARTAEGA